MSAPAVTSLDLRVIETVLEMGGGYVLDFSNRTFSGFFREHGINIDDDRFCVEGSSKANRLRLFLRTSGPPLSGRVLAGLLQHRLVAKPEGLRPEDLENYRKLVVRFGGELPTGATSPATEDHTTAEATLLRRVFKPELFAKLPIDQTMSHALVERMNEAQRCIEANASRAAVILCGSVLEGMCLGYGTRNPERVNRAFSARFNKPAKPLHDWRLSEWIDVLAQEGDLSPNVEKFGHGLRDFRNYVHPAEQLAHHFSPDQHTARIAFQVVIAAAEDLVRAAGAVVKRTGQD
jgi:hypothetical protein